MRRRHLFLIVPGLALGLAAAGLTLPIAKAQEEADKSWLQNFLQSRLSAPGRQVSIGQIDGLLSSSPSIASLTVSDEQGPWLSLQNLSVTWSRAALLRGRLNIDSLGVASMQVTRRPVPAPETADAPAEDGGGGGFSLPIDVTVDQVEIAQIQLAEPVIGQAAELALAGSVRLTSAETAASLDVQRRDQPGEITAEFRLAPGENVLTLDARLSEPAGGLVATAAGIPGAPPIDFSIDGSGPLSDFSAEIALASGQDARIAGTAEVIRADEAYRITADLAGSLAGLAPGDSAALLSGQSRLALDVTRRDDGSLTIARAELESERAQLAASGEIAADFFPERGEVSLSLNEGGAAPIALPGFGGEAAIGSLSLSARLGEGEGAGEAQSWQAELRAQGLRHPLGDVQSLAASGNGSAASLTEPAARRLTFTASAEALGLAPSDADLARALGQSLSASASGAWQAGNPVRIEESRVTGEETQLAYSGAASARSLLGRLEASIGSLSRFSGLAGRELGGAVELTAEGSVDLEAAGFDLTIDAEGTDIASGTAQLDALLEGDTQVRGGIARDGEGGLTFRDLTVNSQALQASADGAYSANAVDLAVRATIDELSRATARASGSVTAEADLSGTPEAPQIEALVTGERLVLMGRQLTGAEARFEGTIAGDVAGAFSLTGNLGGVPIEGSGRLAPGEDGARRLEALSVTAGAAELSGALAILQSGLLDGDLTLRAPNIAEIAPLFLTEAEGAIDLAVALSAAGGEQAAQVQGTIEALKVEQARIEAGRIDLAGSDLFGTPALQGSFGFRGVAAAGFDINSVEGTAERSGEATRFTVAADMAEGDARLIGALAPVAGGLAVELEELAFSHQGVAAQLAAPTTIRIADGGASFEDLRLNAGGGSLVLDGSAGEALDLQLVLDSVNAAVANAFAPSLDLAGSISGEVSVAGTSAAPEPVFDLRWQDASAGALRQANAGPFDIAAKGDYANGLVELDASITGGRGERVEARGTVPVSGSGNLNVTADIVALPAAAINAIRPDLGAEGTVTGRAEASGSLAAPRASFELRWQNASLAATRNAGLSALNVVAAGRYDDGSVRLERGSIGNGALELSVTGTARVTGTQSLDLAITGTAPLALANVQLADRGTALSGTARIDLSVGGSVSSPQISGTVTTSDGGLADPDTGIILRNIALTARFTGERMSLERLNANFAPSGSLTGSGSIGLSGAMPIDLTLNVVEGRYADGDLVNARFDADLAITGSISAGPTIGGTVRINRADITVPETLPGGALTLDVEHVHASGAILRTLRQAKPRSRPEESSGGDINLDLVIDAPARIFVRGRGLDAELGGRLRLSGPSSNVVASGGFQLIRGRLDILTQRITIDRGELNFVGDLDPYLDFSASTQSGETTVTITISGQASDPAVEFSSVPQLPQDEVLAQLLFGRSIADLSPLQVARLAAAAAELGGLTEGPGIFGRLRAATGLDDLDIITDEEGNTAVQAGRYINDNIYLGVQSGTAEESSRVTIDLDITKGVKARGEVGAEGDSSLGIVVEREY
ncbi:translocation/assembly module TamB domain-containing protein [Afifella pfennigii]|uniref:translocation/assembly module TamB domain-containing protein n=1 Tax=Afifella pfennigii TaxID=209897 RepID=UPI0004787D56|nr:translocation/assembly module TamB domain-containing protein [Afifella pfennigii]